MQEVLIQNEKGIPVIEHSAAIHLKRIFNPGFSGYADLKSPSGVVLNCIRSIMIASLVVMKVASESKPWEADFSAGEFASLSFSSNEYYRSALVFIGIATCVVTPVHTCFLL